MLLKKQIRIIIIRQQFSCSRITNLFSFIEKFRLPLYKTEEVSNCFLSLYRILEKDGKLPAKISQFCKVKLFQKREGVIEKIDVSGEGKTLHSHPWMRISVRVHTYTQ